MSKNRPTVQNKEESTQKSTQELDIDFNDQLAVPKAVIKEIEELGMQHRWINAHKLQANYGFDSRGWQPFKSKVLQAGPFSGLDSEGFIRRGDLILAVQSNALAAKRKEVINQKNARNKAYGKDAASQLKDQFNRAGIKSKISSGFDENE